MRGSTKGRRVKLEVSFWWDPKGKAIHLTSNDPGAKTFAVAVREDPSKPSGHPYLFRELVKCLKKMGADAPDSGVDQS
jgi:hypothetical protein